jgi:hypothetical protein
MRFMLSILAASVLLASTKKISMLWWMRFVRCLDIRLNKDRIIIINRGLGLASKPTTLVPIQELLRTSPSAWAIAMMAYPNHASQTLWFRFELSLKRLSCSSFHVQAMQLISPREIPR